MRGNTTGTRSGNGATPSGLRPQHFFGQIMYGLQSVRENSIRESLDVQTGGSSSLQAAELSEKHRGGFSLQAAECSENHRGGFSLQAAEFSEKHRGGFSRGHLKSIFTATARVLTHTLRPLRSGTARSGNDPCFNRETVTDATAGHWKLPEGKRFGGTESTGISTAQPHSAFFDGSSFGCLVEGGYGLSSVRENSIRESLEVQTGGSSSLQAAESSEKHCGGFSRGHLKSIFTATQEDGGRVRALARTLLVPQRIIRGLQPRENFRPQGLHAPFPCKERR